MRLFTSSGRFHWDLSEQFLGGALERAVGPRGGSVKIQKETGRIQEERTYPREPDPARSKGVARGALRPQILRLMARAIGGICRGHIDMQTIHALQVAFG